MTVTMSREHDAEDALRRPRDVMNTAEEAQNVESQNFLAEAEQAPGRHR